MCSAADGHKQSTAEDRVGHNPATGRDRISRRGQRISRSCSRRLHSVPGSCSSGRTNRDNLEQAVQAASLGGIPRVHGNLGGDRGRSDQEVDCPAAPGFASGADSCRVDQTVGTCCRFVEWDFIFFFFCWISWRRARSAKSSVACGPAASSANVIADTATSVGSASAATRSISMTTDVSMRPRGYRFSGTRSRVLVDCSVEIGPEPVRVDGRSAREGRDRRAAATNCRDFTGAHASPTGTPLRVTRKDSPRSRPRMMSPLALRSSRWVMGRLII